jgi:hypothetical protein
MSMGYDAKLEEATRRLWTDLMEFSKHHEVEIQFFGISISTWFNGARVLKINASILNTEIWNELMSLIFRNGLTVKHWFIEAKKDEIRIFLWLHLDLGKEVSVE